MKTINIQSWTELEEWAGTYDHQDRYIFRGQGDSTWTLRTSLARHFLANRVASNEWRRRELKMYRIFRERLLSICPGMYDEWNPLDILSLMQHHGTPTRLLDFTYSPWVASYFAVKDARGDSSVWAIDKDRLAKSQKSQGFEAYSGPTHIEEYKIAKKHPTATVLGPSYPHPRLVAQRGCFLVTGRISKEINDDLIDSHIVLSEGLVLDSITRLRGRGVDSGFLFPDFERIAQETNRFAVTGSPDFPSTSNREN